MAKWTLLDGEVLNEKHPITFQIPDLLERQTVPVGVYVKLGFDAPDAPMAERMWVVVERRSVSGATYQGKLANAPMQPEYFPALGAEILFEPRHILAIQYIRQPGKTVADHRS